MDTVTGEQAKTHHLFDNRQHMQIPELANQCKISAALDTDTLSSAIFVSPESHLINVLIKF